MTWFNELITGSSIAHAVLVLSGTVALGVLLSRIKICGVSLGVTWILFVGIVAGHFGLTVAVSYTHLTLPTMAVV